MIKKFIMDNSNEDFKSKILALLKEFKGLGMDRRRIEVEVDVAEFGIDQALARGGNKTLYNKLARLRKSLDNNIDKSNIGEKESSIITNSPDKEISNELILGLIKNGQTLADSNKSGNDANKILAQNNERLIGMVEYKYMPSSYFEYKSRLIVDEANLKMIDVMARTLVRNGAYPTFDEAIAYLDMLLTSEEEEELFLNKKKQADTQSKHKA